MSSINGCPLLRVCVHGVFLFTTHYSVCALGWVKCRAQIFTCQVKKIIISQVVLPLIDYANIVYQNTSDTYLKPLDVVYNSLCKFVLRSPFHTHHCHMFQFKAPSDWNNLPQSLRSATLM